MCMQVGSAAVSSALKLSIALSPNQSHNCFALRPLSSTGLREDLADRQETIIMEWNGNEDLGVPGIINLSQGFTDALLGWEPPKQGPDWLKIGLVVAASVVVIAVTAGAAAPGVAAAGAATTAATTTATTAAATTAAAATAATTTGLSTGALASLEAAGTAVEFISQGTDVSSTWEEGAVHSPVIR